MHKSNVKVAAKRWPDSIQCGTGQTKGKYLKCKLKLRQEGALASHPTDTTTVDIFMLFDILYCCLQLISIKLTSLCLGTENKFIEIRVSVGCCVYYVPTHHIHFGRFSLTAVACCRFGSMFKKTLALTTHIFVMMVYTQSIHTHLPFCLAKENVSIFRSNPNDIMMINGLITSSRGMGKFFFPNFFHLTFADSGLS